MEYNSDGLDSVNILPFNDLRSIAEQELRISALVMIAQVLGVCKQLPILLCLKIWSPCPG